MKKLKKLIDRLFKLEDGLVLFLNVTDCVFHFRMRLAHDLFLHQLFARCRIRCQLIELLLRRIFFNHFELFFDAVLHRIFELSLDRLRCPEDVLELGSEGPMHSFFHTSFGLSCVLDYRFLDVLLHDVQMCLDFLENLLVLFNDGVELRCFDYNWQEIETELGSPQTCTYSPNSLTYCHGFLSSRSDAFGCCSVRISGANVRFLECGP